MNIGVDIDGVLANFTDAYTSAFVMITGTDRFPARPFDVPTWHYPQHYGYTEDDVKTVWRGIKADPAFWERLYPTREAGQLLRFLTTRSVTGDSVTFITDRPGVEAAKQTERWLSRHGMVEPNVIISAKKGEVACELNLHVYIDDKPENVQSVVNESPNTVMLYLTCPYNLTIPVVGSKRVGSIMTLADVVTKMAP